MFLFIKRFDVRISVLYGIIATLWIVFSDSLALLLFGNNHPLETVINIFKGLGFVVVTTLALYFVLSAELRKRAYIEHELQLERDISPVAIMVVDTQGLISYVNVQAEKIFGQSRDTIVGKKYSVSLWNAADYDGNPIASDYPNFTKMMETRQTVFGVQQTIEVASGNRVMLEINLAPIFNEADVITGAVVTFNDVTSTKTQEKQLLESEESLKRAQLISHVGDWTWNTQTNNVRASDELYRIFNLDRATSGGDLNEILERVVHPDDHEKIMEAIGFFLNEQQSGALEFRIVWADGSVHHVWAEADIPINDAKGNLLSLSGIVQDITERKQAEKSLLESQSRYFTLVEQASDGIFLANSEGRYIEVNSVGCQLLGYNREEILQKTMHDLVKAAPSSPLRFNELRAGKTIISERQLIRKDGSLVWVEISSKQLLDGSLQGIARDITERKRVEEEIRLKSAALESAANGIMITDINGTIEWINPAFTTLTGYTLEEALGHNPRDLVRSGQHNRLFYAAMWDTILAGEVWHGELVNRRNNGSLYTQEETITPVRDQSGEISHFIAIQQDVSQRKLTEAAIHNLNTELEERVIERTTQLNHIKNRIESILNSNADSIVYSRLDGGIEQVNPAFAKAFGYQVDEVLLKPLAKLVIAEDASRLEQVLVNVVATRQAQQVDLTAVLKDGNTFEAAVMVSPVIENNDQMVGIVLSIHDVTNRKHLLHHAMGLSELKSRYVSMAAHDLRNPMAVILTSSDTLQHYSDRLTEDKKQAKFDQIKASIKNMTDILDDVLVMGQVDAGKLDFRPAPLDVTAFCQTLIAEIIQATGTTLHVDLSIEGLNGTVATDAKLLRHILGNLLSNAIKYSQADSVVNFRVQGAPEQLTFHIQDHGIGIPKDEQWRLFETFYRASNAKNIRGTGLGLAIVKQSVELHGGTITFESEEGCGTTFIVTLPLAAS